MDIYKLKILEDKKKFYDIFNYYITKKNFYTKFNKFKKLTYTKTDQDIYKYLNLFKIIENDKLIFIKKNISNYFYIFNKLSKKELNYSSLLFKENNKIIINKIEFPYIDTYNEIMNIKRYTIKHVYKNSIIFINFEIINNDNYSINLELQFDIKLIDIYIANLNLILKNIYTILNITIIK